VCREVRLPAHEEVRREDPQRDERAHDVGRRQAGEQRRDAGEVDDVIDVVAVARALLFTDAGQRTVEAVAEPVGEETQDDHGYRRSRVEESERQAGGHHRPEPEQAQVIRTDPSGQPAGDPDERAFLGRRKQTQMRSYVTGRAGVG
jgi:hypothetical protein